VDRLVDGFGLSWEIWILGADDDASVRWLQADEIALVDRQDSSPYLSGEPKDFGIRDRLVGISGFLTGQHVMAKRA
jgi:hypothetical protein